MAGSSSTLSIYGLNPRWITRLVLLVSLLFAILLLEPGSGDKGTIALCLLASIVITIFWPSIQGFENLKIGPTGLELTRKFDEVEKKADNAARTADGALEAITRFVFNSMPKPIFENLRKIARGFGAFEMNDGFRSQLRTLRDSGYISTLNGTQIGSLPPSGNQLSDYIVCTELGKEFIRRRLEIEAIAEGKDAP